MLHAGISLADSAFLLATEEDSDLLNSLGQSLDQGTALSQALVDAKIFPHYLVGMVRIGEETGQLEEALAALADFFEQRHRIRRQLSGAVAYPSMILALMLLVIGVLLIKVLPVFDQVYASLGSGLTGIAAGLLTLGQWLKAALPFFFGLLVVLAVAVTVFALFQPLRGKAAALLRRRFGDRGISRKYNNARFARAMAMGLASGLTLEQTLTLTQELLSDIPGAARRCARCAEALQAGASLADAMGAQDLLSPAQCRLLNVGIRGGNSDRVMAKIADDLAEEADASLEQTVSRIEPAMVLASSILVGAILLAVMIPLMNILSSLG